VSELIGETLRARGISVTVYDPPTLDHESALMQGDLFEA
jgi:hypothetical protein